MNTLYGNTLRTVLGTAVTVESNGMGHAVKYTLTHFSIVTHPLHKAVQNVNISDLVVEQIHCWVQYS